MTVAVTVACLAGAGLDALRWLRVAQREHYEPGRVPAFQRRWQPAWVPVALVTLGAVAAASSQPWAALPAAVAAAVGPRGLGLRGRSSPLAWTRRLRSLALVTAALLGVVAAAPLALGGTAWLGAFVAAVGAPWVVDLATRVTRPFERRAGRRFVADAQAALRQVDPTVVAITGSYGKTTTKGYLRHLIEGSRSVVASPASFNNTAGLSRAVNENLHPGTEVFIAEMGAYGPGEIAELCSWVRPSVGAICAIGPVHLERYGTLDRIVAAKSEILADVEICVLNVDAHGMAALADSSRRRGQRVVTCSTSDPAADVVVAGTETTLEVSVYGSPLASVDPSGRHPSNVAVAVGLALAVDVDGPHIAERLVDLPVAEHRQQVVTAPTGVIVIDDTFNANPAGATAALAALRRHGTPGRRMVVVTPGMVEMGDRSDEENSAFGEAAAQSATDVIIVGRTNRAALRVGTARAVASPPADVIEVAHRDDAVRWVRTNLAAGDVVLYENDLPDHYP